MSGHGADMSDTSDILIDKKRLRGEAFVRRDALPANVRQAAANAIAARQFPLPIPPRIILSGFMPMKTEIDPLPLMKKLEGQGARLALPVLAGRGKPLVMRAWAFGEPLSEGVWGIREPEPEADEVAPDILLVPLLAFDRTGGRIGYGGGYYDRTIAALRAKKRVIAVGIAFAAQEVAQVPVGAGDARLDLVLTELEVIDFRGS
jgi:5-formyltetrahydrofolate cyclo-ligase